MEWNISRPLRGYCYWPASGSVGNIRKPASIIRPSIPAFITFLVPPARVIDTNGAGDVFHGAYIYSYLTHPAMSWERHFRFARAAAAFKVQRLGNEAGLPTLADIAALEQEFAPAPAL